MGGKKIYLLSFGGRECFFLKDVCYVMSFLYHKFSRFMVSSNLFWIYNFFSRFLYIKGGDVTLALKKNYSNSGVVQQWHGHWPGRFKTSQKHFIESHAAPLFRLTRYHCLLEEFSWKLRTIYLSHLMFDTNVKCWATKNFFSV